MKLTNQQILDAVAALELFNPSVSFKVKTRLNRNLRKLNSAKHDFDHDRSRLVSSAYLDKTKRPDKSEGSPLTPEEQLRYQKDLRQLLAEEVEVEIHPVELYDGSESKPEDTKGSIDLAEVAIPNEIYSRLIDIILIPVEEATV